MLVFAAKGILLAFDLYLTVSTFRWLKDQVKKDFRSIKEFIQRKRQAHKQSPSLAAELEQRYQQEQVAKPSTKIRERITKPITEYAMPVISRVFVVHPKGEVEEKETVRIPVSNSSMQAQGEKMGVLAHA